MNETLKIKYFENIPTVPSKERISSRLGYRKGVTEIKASDVSLIEECIRQGSYLFKPDGYLYEYIHNDGNNNPNETICMQMKKFNNCTVPIEKRKYYR